jgi:hypothetical protein
MSPGQLLGLGQVADSAVKAPIGGQLDLVAVVEDLHGGLRRLGEWGAGFRVACHRP